MANSNLSPATDGSSDNVFATLTADLVTVRLVRGASYGPTPDGTLKRGETTRVPRERADYLIEHLGFKEVK